ncbi:hypothetical protein K505DRAFT_326806 [Melanomma pulvis-pyrius CBS 109.77]|uniref:Uncharacterized protein n=1 Tax=Melanomma pulvis-pyrius CBS 109.77 TaxID=1314802 RepID=A0A6A6X5C3_9PLEO|nr:hypothetical protein K505DRAFT_326806 [Melanomma pulvis-pyrius CBS 109.77]
MRVCTAGLYHVGAGLVVLTLPVCDVLLGKIFATVVRTTLAGGHAEATGFEP